MAVDCAIMLLDAAKGVEEQTVKLFKVCRDRGIPIITFINKMDRPALSPFELMDNVEKVLGITTVPMTYPIGDGTGFKGVYERNTGTLHLFEKQKVINIVLQLSQKVLMIQVLLLCLVSMHIQN